MSTLFFFSPLLTPSPSKKERKKKSQPEDACVTLNSLLYYILLIWAHDCFIITWQFWSLSVIFIQISLVFGSMNLSSKLTQSSSYILEYWPHTSTFLFPQLKHFCLFLKWTGPPVNYSSSETVQNFLQNKQIFKITCFEFCCTNWLISLSF